MSLFWQGLPKATQVEILDKIMIGKNIDGSTEYADINQIKLLLGAFLSGQIIPGTVSDGADLGSPDEAAVLYAGPGEYITPSGTITLTGNLNMLFWDKEEWSYLEIPVDVDLTPYAEKTEVLSLAGFTPTKNRFNKATVIQDRYPSPTNGELVNNSTMVCSDYIPGLPGDVVSQNKTASLAIAFYDASKVFISGLAAVTTYTLPAGTAFQRNGCLKTDVDIFQVEKSPLPTSYLPYGYINKALVIEDDNVKYANLRKIIGFVPAQNLFDKTTVTTDRYVSDVNGALAFNVNFASSAFIEFLPLTKGTQSYMQTTAFYDNSFTYISSVTGIANQKWTSPANTKYIRTSVLKTELNTFMLVVGWDLPGSYVSFTSVLFNDLLVNENQIIKNTIGNVKTVGTGKDFATISLALAAITDASATKRYTIAVDIGTYQETFTTKNYVDIIGAEPNKVIINYTAPADGQFNSYSTIFATTTTKLKNLIITGANSKYPIHSDAGGANAGYLLELENVYCEHKGYTDGSQVAGAALGIGLYQNQHIKASKCVFKGFSAAYNTTGSTVFIHDQAVSSGLGYRSLTIENSYISGGGYGLRVDLNNTTSNSMSNDIFLTNNNFSSLVSDIYLSGTSAGWTWNINAVGNKIRKVRNAGGNAYIVEEVGFTKVFRNRSAGIILKNTAVVLDANNYGCIVNTIVANKNDVIGITLEDVASNSSGRVQISGWASVKVNGTVAIAIGDFIGTYTVQGISQKSTTGTKYGIARAAYAVADSNGLIDVILTDVVY